jgi:hypothetical protein
MSADVEIERLWKMAYDTFEKRPTAFLRLAFGMKGGGDSVQHRLMANIARLKTEPPNAAIIESIRGDLMVAQTVGYLSETDAEKFQKQLDKINLKGEK